MNTFKESQKDSERQGVGEGRWQNGSAVIVIIHQEKKKKKKSMNAFAVVRYRALTTAIYLE